MWLAEAVGSARIRRDVADRYVPWDWAPARPQSAVAVRSAVLEQQPRRRRHAYGSPLRAAPTVIRQPSAGHVTVANAACHAVKSARCRPAVSDPPCTVQAAMP